MCNHAGSCDIGISPEYDISQEKKAIEVEVAKNIEGYEEIRYRLKLMDSDEDWLILYRMYFNGVLWKNGLMIPAKTIMKDFPWIHDEQFIESLCGDEDE